MRKGDVSVIIKIGYQFLYKGKRCIENDLNIIIKSIDGRIK